jgi:hypothetical protein
MVRTAQAIETVQTAETAETVQTAETVETFEPIFLKGEIYGCKTIRRP